MKEGEPKNEKSKPKQVPETWSTDSKIIKEEEIKKIQEYVNKNKIGVDDGQPKIVYNTEGLLESIERDGKMLLFEVEAEEAPGNNQIKLIEGVKKKIIALEKDKKDLEKSLVENSNKMNNIKITLEIERLEGIINYLENKIKLITEQG